MIIAVSFQKFSRRVRSDDFVENAGVLGKFIVKYSSVVF